MPKPINNPLPSCSFINLDFLLPDTTYFDDTIFLPFFSLQHFWNLHSHYSFYMSDSTATYNDLVKQLVSVILSQAVFCISKVHVVLIRLYFSIATSKSSLSINMWFIFDMQLVNGELYLRIRFLFYPSKDRLVSVRISNGFFDNDLIAWFVPIICIARLIMIFYSAFSAKFWYSFA